MERKNLLPIKHLHRQKIGMKRFRDEPTLAEVCLDEPRQSMHTATEF